MKLSLSYDIKHYNYYLNSSRMAPGVAFLPSPLPRPWFYNNHSSFTSCTLDAILLASSSASAKRVIFECLPVVGFLFLGFVFSNWPEFSAGRRRNTHRSSDDRGTRDTCVLRQNVFRTCVSGAGDAFVVPMATMVYCRDLTPCNHYKLYLLLLPVCIYIYTWPY